MTSWCADTSGRRGGFCLFGEFPEIAVRSHAEVGEEFFQGTVPAARHDLLVAFVDAEFAAMKAEIEAEDGS